MSAESLFEDLSQHPNSIPYWDELNGVDVQERLQYLLKRKQRNKFCRRRMRIRKREKMIMGLAMREVQSFPLPI